jgi:hypothetical protein
MLNLKRFTCLALVSMTGASLHILDGSPAWAGDQLNAPPGSFVQSTNANPNLNLNPSSKLKLRLRIKIKASTRRRS